MVMRGVGQVGCAHCKVVGADRPCQICTRQICETCAADWATCDEPSGRVVRLGLTARVRDVDPLGRLALVSHWRQPLRLFDLRQLRWVSGSTLPRAWWLVGRANPPRLTSDGHVVHIEYITNEYVDDRAIEWTVLDGSHPPMHVRLDAPSQGTGVSAVGNRFWYLSDTQRVIVMYQRVAENAPATTSVVALGELPRATPTLVYARYEPWPRKVVQAAHVDGERDLLASATWSELALHRMVGAELQSLGRAKTWHEGNVEWIAVGGPYLAALVGRGGMSFDSYLEVHRLNDDQSIGEVAYRVAIGGHCIAALSRDGRYLAVSVGDRVRVRNLDTGATSDYDGHSDHINYLRFAADDHVLISADTDNRVILRPRTPTGYARPLIPISVPAG